MKIKYFLSLFISVLLFSACSTDDTIGSLANIKVDKTYLSIAEEGGDAVVTINSNDAWAFDKIFQITTKGADGKNVTSYSELPTWLTADVLTGAAGETKVTFHANATSGGREANLRISVGDQAQFINIRQGSMEASTATCKEVNTGIDGKTYRIKGTVTSIANTTYGNMYINDGTGTAYVYGTLDKNGATKNFSSLNIEVGDIVECEGPRKTYNGTVELENVTVLSINKSLIKVISPEITVAKEKTEFSVKVAYKGNGAFVTIPAEAQNWISSVDTKYYQGVKTYVNPNPADTAEFKFLAAPNEAGARKATLEFKSYSGSKSSTVTCVVTQEGSIVAASIADFLKATSGQFRLTGYISQIKDAAKGNFYIKDFSGETYVYSLSGFNTKGLKVGDIVTLVGERTAFKGTPQVGKAQIESSQVVKAISAADFNKLPDDKTKSVYYSLTGKVTKPAKTGNKFDLATYGNFDLVDATGAVYIYGVSTGLGGEPKKFGTLNIKEGDEITIYAYKTSFKNAPQGVGLFISKK